MDMLRISELNLPALGRAYRMIRIYMYPDHDVAHSGRGRDSDEKDLAMCKAFVNWLFADGPYRKEKDIALRIILEEQLEAPAMEKIMDQILGETLP